MIKNKEGWVFAQGGICEEEKREFFKFWNGVEWWLEHRFQQLEELGWKENNSILYSFSIGGFGVS